MSWRGSARRTWIAVVLISAFFPVFHGATLSSAKADSDDSTVASDPFEGMNRGIFWFNVEVLDRYLLEPVSKGWDFIVPDPVERALARAMSNLEFPVVFVNELLQAKPVAASRDLVRFLVNSTLGIAGLFDPAATFGFNGGNEDFGQTLGYWGIPPGPYLILPILGSSNPRDGVGLAADSAARVYPFFAPFWVSFAHRVPDAVNQRSLSADTIDAEREAAFDFYVAVRNAYMQHRRNLVHDRQDAESNGNQDLYYPDELDDE